LRLAALAGTSAAMGLFLQGCSTEQSSSQETASQENDNTSQAEQSEQAEQNSVTGSQTLIAVFSWSGNTLQVAERIHELIQGDFFRIEPANPYTDNYNELLDIAQQEQDDDARPALAASIENWDDYATIYLGTLFGGTMRLRSSKHFLKPITHQENYLFRFAQAEDPASSKLCQV